MDEYNKKNRPTQKDWDELLLKVGECMRDHALLIAKTSEMAALAKIEAAHKPLPKKKKTVWIAVNPRKNSDGEHGTTVAICPKPDTENIYHWPVYPLEIEVDE